MIDKKKAISLELIIYEHRIIHNRFKLVDNDEGDKLIISDQSGKKNVTISELWGNFLLEFLNMDLKDKKQVKEYYLDKYGLVAFKSIFEENTKQELKFEFANKKEYNEYAEFVFETCYNDLLEAQVFFKDYVSKIFDLAKIERYTKAEKQMREIIFMHDETSNIQLYKKYERYVVDNLDMENGRRKNEDWGDFTLTKAYYIFTADNIIAIYYAFLKCLSKYRSFTVNTCMHCGDYFIPEMKNNEKFCTKVFPDGTTCKKLGVRDNWKNSLEEDEVRKLYNNTYQRKLMYCKRNPDNIQAKQEFEEWKKEVKQQMKKYKKGDIESKEILIILDK